MNILLLSAYDAPSHKRWRLGLMAALTQHNWTCLTLPPRFFAWRVRGNSLTWSQDPLLKESYDLVIATSMTDLSALKGLVPSLAGTPCIVYFHENQFAYPDNEQQRFKLEPAVLNLYSAMAADRIIFNSDYNRQSFFQGVSEFLAKMPDQVPAGICQQLMAKSSVVPVPLESHCYHAGNKAERLTLLWNHRWEYDKGPDRLEAICSELIRRKLDFQLHLLGQGFRDTPAEITRLIAKLKANGCLAECGFVESAGKYASLVEQSHFVLSTAVHEFQGLAVLEAMAAGCIPVVPDRLAYKEFVPDEFRYHSDFLPSSENEFGRETVAAADKIIAMATNFDGIQPPDVSHLSWHLLAPVYGDLIDTTAG